MLKVGLTGGIGSGKTSVSNLFQKLGIPIIDTDVIAHELVNNHPKILQEIADTFGHDVLNINGELNRKKLAKIIFNVRKNKQQLENILHPRIQNEVTQQLKTLASKKKPPNYTIVVIPLLIEKNYDNFIDRILVVTASKNKRIKRIQQRDGRSFNEIHSIIGNQVNDKKRQEKADDIIENNNDIKSLSSQVKKLHESYLHLS